MQTYARNGLVYTIERANGAMVGAKPYLDNVNWTKGIGTYSGLADPTSVAVGWDLIPPQRRGLLCSRRERPRHRADCSLSADRRHEILSSHSLIPPIEILSRAGDEALEKLYAEFTSAWKEKDLEAFSKIITPAQFGYIQPVINPIKGHPENVAIIEWQPLVSAKLYDAVRLSDKAVELTVEMVTDNKIADNSSSWIAESDARAGPLWTLTKDNDGKWQIDSWESASGARGPRVTTFVPQPWLPLDIP